MKQPQIEKLKSAILARPPEATIRLRERGKLMCEQLRMKVYRIAGTFYSQVESKPGTKTHRSEPLTLHATNLNDAKDEAETLLGIIRSTMPDKKDISPALAVHLAVVPELETPTWLLDLQADAVSNSTQQTPQVPALAHHVLHLAGLNGSGPTNLRSGTAPTLLDHLPE